MVSVLRTPLKGYIMAGLAYCWLVSSAVARRALLPPIAYTLFL